MNRNKKNSMAGFSLLEVLISFAILSIAILSWISFTSGAVRNHLSTEKKTLALQEASRILENVRNQHWDETVAALPGTVYVDPPDRSAIGLDAGETVPDDIDDYHGQTITHDGFTSTITVAYVTFPGVSNKAVFSTTDFKKITVTTRWGVSKSSFTLSTVVANGMPRKSVRPGDL